MEAWNQAWNTAEGREAWMHPEPFVQACIPTLQAVGVRRVLDLGIGVGRHAIQLVQAGFEVHGIDAAINGLAFAAGWAKETGVALSLAAANMTAIPYPDDSFDAILTWNVIYHGDAKTVDNTLREIERALKPRGYLVCSLISTQHPKFGLGQEIEHHTFVIPEGGEREHPHRYFNRAEVESYLGNFELLRYEDTTQKSADDYHWHILARQA